MKKSLVFFLLSIYVLGAFSQTNIMKVDWQKLSKLESGIQLDFKMAAIGVKLGLGGEEVPDYAYYFKCCTFKIPHNIEQTIAGLKMNRNQRWTFYFSLIYDSNGKYTDYAYAGYIITEYGENTQEYLIKVKKTRLYPENNIYTEKITFTNGVSFLIEERRYVRKVILPEITLTNEDYYYKDCSSK
ncbi:MAG: hypothetical protein KA163_09260 [Bacteroidia bacterium]|nr:hypothetical protein [Bacteroidia bacterium]